MIDNKLSYKLLYYLLHHQNQFVSGQQLADYFEVSRTAIWKTITQLQQQGYQIQSVKHKGYCLTIHSNEIISAPLLTYMAQQAHFCHNVFYEDVVDSTQIQAKKYLAEQYEDFAVIANSQTAGYGRFHRPWQSNAGQGLWMTVVKKSTVPFTKLGCFNLVMACGIHKALSKFIDEPKRLQIKWPNDIYYDNYKVCGFLSEVLINENQQMMIIYGMGINILSAPVMDNIYQAGALQQFSHQSISYIAVINELFKKLSQSYHEFSQYDFLEFKEYWTEHSLVWDRWLKYTTSEESFIGKATMLTDEGYLIVVDKQGEKYTLMSADIDF